MSRGTDASHHPSFKRSRRYQIGIRALIALVACCALILWTARVVWQNRDPFLAEERTIEASARRSLQSPDGKQRVAAIQTLGRLSISENTTTMRGLVAMLADRNPVVRAASAEALGEFGIRAVETGAGKESVAEATASLITILQDPQPKVRIAAAITLGYIASARPRPDDNAAQPPGGAAMVSTSVDTRAVVAALTDALRDSDVKVRGAAIVALGTAGKLLARPPQALEASVRDESAENREVAVRALARFRRGLDSWIPSLLELAEHDPDQSVRAAAAKALSAELRPPAITAECVPALIEALKHGDWKLRSVVTNLLHQLGPQAREAVPTLLSILTARIDRNEKSPGFERQSFAWAAAGALGRVDPGSASAPQVVARLMEAARSGDRVIKSPAIYALSHFGPDAAPAVPVLIQLAREAAASQDADIENTIARALGLIAPGTRAEEEAVMVLTTVLGSKYSPSRIGAIEALGHFGPKAAIAIPKIRSLCNDENALVKQAAERALVILTAEEDVEPEH